MVSDTQAALSGRREISSAGLASVPLSKPGEMSGLGDRNVTSAAVTLRTLVTALCEKKAPLCGRERPSIDRVCLGSWRGEAKSWQRSYGTSPNRATMFNGKNKSLLCHTLRNTVGVQCDIVPNNRSFNTASFTKPLPAQRSCFFSSSTDQMQDDQMQDDCSKATITQGWTLLDLFWTKCTASWRNSSTLTLSLQERDEKISITLGAEAVRRFA